MENNNKIENTGNNQRSYPSRAREPANRQEPLRGKKWIFIGIVAVVVIVVGAFMFLNLGEETEEIAKKVIGEGEERVLYVVDSSWKPYMWEDGDGEVVGFAVDLLDRIMTELNISYKFEILPWARALKLLEMGAADAGLVVSHSAERESIFYFNEEQIKFNTEGTEMPEFTFVESEAVFFVRKLFVDSIKFESFEQIARDDYRVGVVVGFNYENLGDDMNLVEVISEEQAMLDLNKGLIDMYPRNKLVGLSVVKKLNLTEEIIFLDKKVSSTPMYMLFSRNSDYPNLEQINEEVHRVTLELKESGEYDEIYGRYMNG
jgi:polar amino acid transport system substrate-binding protein